MLTLIGYKFISTFLYNMAFSSQA
ncbi:MAG: LasU family protein [Gammaproteobacteria bacterium]